MILDIDRPLEQLDGMRALSRVIYKTEHGIGHCIVMLVVGCTAWCSNLLLRRATGSNEGTRKGNQRLRGLSPLFDSPLGSNVLCRCNVLRISLSSAVADSAN